MPLNDTFVPFINERDGIGHLIPRVRLIMKILIIVFLLELERDIYAREVV